VEQKEVSSTATASSSASSTPVELSPALPSSPNGAQSQQAQTPIRTSLPSSAELSAVAAEAKAAIGSWGAGIGSFWSAKTARFSKPIASPPVASPVETPDRDATTSFHSTSPSVSSSISRPSIASVESNRAQPQQDAHNQQATDHSLPSLDIAPSSHIMADGEDDEAAYATGMAV